MAGIVESVNLGSAQVNVHKPGSTTGLGKRPRLGPVAVRDPGPSPTGSAAG